MIALTRIAVVSTGLLIVGFLLGPQAAQAQMVFQVEFCFPTESASCPDPQDDRFRPDGDALIEFVSASCSTSDSSTKLLSLRMTTTLVTPPENKTHHLEPHLKGPARNGPGEVYVVSQETRIYAKDNTVVRLRSFQSGQGEVRCRGVVSGQLFPPPPPE